MTFDMTAFQDDYATLEDMHAWAASVMQHPPHFHIGDGYMDRWYILPRNKEQNVYLHRTMQNDGDVMHDHPWDNTSLLIWGSYIEETPTDNFLRSPGDVIHRKAEDAHRLILVGDYTISLFFTGPKRREWGFLCPNGWVDWKTFTGNNHSGRSEKGAGCGEP